MKYFLPVSIALMLSACHVANVNDKPATSASPAPVVTVPNVATVTNNQCPGNVDLPAELANQFEAVTDDALLNSTISAANAGNLCQGRVYQAKTNVKVTLYRAWNTTNPNSRLGHWWAFTKPTGKTAQYRTDYEICYQFSPLDKLSQCQLAAGAKIVVGTGQSVKCSDYLTYPAAAAKQVYIQDAGSVLNSCQDFDEVFDWQVVK